MKYRILIIGVAVLVSLALQVGELSAFGSPVEQPPPPRPMAPTPPVHVDAQRKASGHPQSKHEPSEPLTLASVDGAGLVWAMVVETGD